MPVEPNLQMRQVYRWEKTLGRLLGAGSVLSIAVVAARALNSGSTVDVLDTAEIPLKAVWVVFAVGTALHLFAAIWLRRSVADLIRVGDPVHV
jgi:hypothetical protein